MNIENNVDSVCHNNGYTDDKQENCLSTSTTRSNDDNDDSDAYVNFDLKHYINLNVFAGLRCIASIAVLLYHVQWVWIKFLFVRDSPCCLALKANPILDAFLFRISWHMTLFWMLSGFLCEYQLHQLLLKIVRQQQVNDDNNNKDSAATVSTTKKVYDLKSISLSWYDCYTFLWNRILRLYPLYILLPIGTYLRYTFFNTVIPDGNSFTWKHLLAILTFTMPWNLGSPISPGVTWSVQVDVHGYIALLTLFILTYQQTYLIRSEKKNWPSLLQPTTIKGKILVGLYICSLVHVFSYDPLPEKNLTKDEIDNLLTYGTIGIDIIPEQFLGMADVGGRAGRDELYPNFDFNNSTVLSIQNYTKKLLFSTYFSSIFNHGSAVFLGSLLYLKYCRKYQSPTNGHDVDGKILSKPSNNASLICIAKMIFSFRYLLKVKGWFSLSGISNYFFLDAILTMSSLTNDFQHTYTQPSSIVSLVTQKIQVLCDTMCQWIVRFLSMNIFRWLAQYTYAIYLFHTAIIFTRKGQVLPILIDAIKTGAQNNIEACQAVEDAGYPMTINFIIYETIITFVISLLLAIVLHKLIDEPIRRFRKKESIVDPPSRASKMIKDKAM